MAGVRMGEAGQSQGPVARASAMVRAIPVLLTVAGGLICYALFFNRGLGLSVIGYNIAPAERVLQGEVPYRDFLFNYTPGILWVNALLMKAFGATLMATRVGLFVFKMLTLLALFFLGRRLVGNWAALLPVVLSLAWPGHQQIFNVYPDQYLMLFALASLFCILNYDRTGRGSWLLLGGLAAGAVFLFKHNVGVLLLSACIAGVTAREMMTTRRVGSASRAVALCSIGFAPAVTALLAYLIYNHALGAMVDHFLHHAVEYSETRAVALPSPNSVGPAAMLLIPLIAIGVLILFGAGRVFMYYWIAAAIVFAWFVLENPRGKVFSDSVIAWVAYFPPLVFIAALIAGVWQLKKMRVDQSRWRENGAVVITGLFALAVYLEVFPRADYYHLVRVLAPVFLFLIVLLYRSLPALRGFIRSHTAATSRAAMLVLASPMFFLLITGVKDTWIPQFDSGFHFRDNRELTIHRGRGILVEEKQADLTEGLVRLIQDNSAPNDYIFSFAQRGSALYFLAARRNPTRFLWWRSVGISSEERDAVMRMIADRRAKLIIVQDVAANRDIQDFIGAGYDHIGTVADIAVYGLRKPFGDAASDKLTTN